MTPKLIALDMDNTLLKSDRTLSHKNATILKKLHADNHHIVLTTGRPFPNVQPFLTQLDLSKNDDYVILFNGGVVKNISTNETLLNKRFMLSDMSEIFNLIHNLKLPIDIVCPEIVYSIADFGQSNYVNLIGKLLHYQQVSITDLPTTLTFNKFVVCETEDKLNYLENILNHTPVLTKNISFTRSRRTLLEFVPTNVSKGAALKVLLKKLSLTSKDLIVFGDEANDLSMFKLATVSVAMANAIPLIKSAATDITSSNEEDGVATFLSSYFNI